MRYKYNGELLHSSISIFHSTPARQQGFFFTEGGDPIMNLIILKSLEEIATVLAVMFVRSLFEENSR